MTTRRLFLVCISALASMSIGLGVWLLVNAIRNDRLSYRLEQTVNIDRQLFALADQLAIERANIADNLQAEEPADAAARRWINAIRASSERALAATERQLAASGDAGALRQLDIIRAAYADLATWRTRFDGMVLLARPEREPELVAADSQAFDRTHDALDRALDIGDIGSLYEDGAALDLVELARRVSLLRTLIVSRTGILLASLDDGGQPVDATAAAMSRSEGALSLGWNLIDAAGRRLPDMAATLSMAHTAFDQLEELHHRIMAGAARDRPTPAASFELSKVTVQTGLKLLAARDAALNAVGTRVAARRRQALVDVVLVAVCLLLICAVTLLVVQVVRRQIVAPLVSLIRVIDRLAQGDYQLTVPRYRRSDVIGRMANSIEALRQGALAAETSKAQVAFMAHHDGLTELPNRILFQERVEQAIAMCGRGQRCAVLCLDLDRFKSVNDGFGHPVGDLLLQAVAERLLACVREVDTATRLGGDEFAVLMVGLDHPERAGMLAQRIVATLSEPYELNGHTIVIGASVGIAIGPQDATSTVKLLKSADTALYRAKSEERGTYRYFEAEMDARLQARVALERDLRLAVRNEAFDLAFQPLYNLLENTLISFEALLRWNHPVRGAVDPADFIPLAEETGLIVPLGAWVLRQACIEAAFWPDHIRVAVNLSAAQIKHRSLVETVRHALAAAALPGHRLDLEITESVLLHNGEETLATLHELRALGVRISMDDFGTGYSSLSYLRSFPFDKIKIDRSFVRDMSDQEDSIAIIRAVVGLGRSLGMATTAEGVETEEQLAQLRREGCTEVQGYLFSRPAPADVARRLARGKPPDLTAEVEAACG